MVKKIGDTSPKTPNNSGFSDKNIEQAKVGDFLGKPVEKIVTRTQISKEENCTASGKQAIDRSISRCSSDSGVDDGYDDAEFYFESAWTELKKSKNRMHDDEYDHAAKSLRSLECLSNSTEEIAQLLFSDKTSLEKSIQFAKLTKGLNIDPTRSTPDSIVRACNTYVEQFIQLFENEGVNKAELFQKYFKVGSLCFGSRSRAASDFFVDQWRKDYQSGSSCKGNFTSFPEPPEPESLYTRYTSQSTVEDILFDEVRILREILTQQGDFNPAEDSITSLQFQKFLESKDGMIGYRGIDGEVNKQTIERFIENENYLFE